MLQSVEVVGGVLGQLVGLADSRRDDQPGEQRQEPNAQQEDDRHRPAAGQAPTLEPLDLRVQAHGELATPCGLRLDRGLVPTPPAPLHPRPPQPHRARKEPGRHANRCRRCQALTCPRRRFDSTSTDGAGCWCLVRHTVWLRPAVVEVFRPSAERPRLGGPEEGKALSRLEVNVG
jgi:hypothetical protein